MDQDTRFMRMALDQAVEARHRGEVPVGAVLVVAGEPVGRGRNSPVTTADPTAHAEILALREAAKRTGNYRLPGATLYSTVEPCLMCLGAMLHARIGRLVYGAADPKIGATVRLTSMRDLGAGFNHDFEIQGGILADESSRMLQRFFLERRMRRDAARES